jgi:hypothetical protein
VRHRFEAYTGVIDGSMEIVADSERNPDEKTQYRVKVGDSPRLFVAENHLNILLDQKHVVLVDREPDQYHRAFTDRLRAVFPEDRFMGQ